MNVQLLNIAVVVLGEQHNPTILHPAFLASQGIVEPGWDLAESPICTPPFAVVKYANGVSFTTELRKFQVLDEALQEGLGASRAPAMASKYIAALPHVRYTAVGINFNAVARCDDPENLLIDRFLKPGAWHNQQCRPKAFSCRLVYEGHAVSPRFSLNGAQPFRNWAFVPGSAQRPGEEAISGILLSANFHTGVADLDEAQRAIARFKDYAEEFRRRARQLLDVEVPQ